MKTLPLLLVLAGCGLDPLGSLVDEDSGTEASDGDAPSDLSFDPAVIDFGAVDLGQSASIDLLIRNNTDEGVEVADAAITGDSAGFFVDSLFGFPIPIQSGADAFVTVTFSPSEDLDYAADLAFALGPDLYTVPLSGVGGEGGGSGDGGDGGGGGDPDALSSSSSSLSFVDTYAGSVSTQQLTLTNNSAGDLLVSDILFDEATTWLVTPAAGENFTIPQVISSGNSKTLDVTFAPADIRSYSDTMRIQVQGEDEVRVALSGNGTEPPCIVCDPTLVVDTGSSDPTLLAVGSVFNIPGTAPLILQNQSDVDLVITDVSLVNDTQGGTFSMSGLGPTTIAPWSSVTGQVTFTCPTLCFDLPNFITGENYITIRSNDPDDDPYEVGLTALTE